MKPILAGAMLAITAFAAATARGQTGNTTMAIQVDRPGAVISPNLFGIFFEEINNSGDGGLYAELVRNRSFEDAGTSPWQLVTTGEGVGSMAADTSSPLNASNPTSLQLVQTSASGTTGAANAGFWGMNLQAGATYDLTFFARGTDGFSGALTARLENSDGSQVLAQQSVGGLTTAWTKFAVSLTPDATATNGRLVIALSAPGTVWLDMVSLFPHDTFRSHANGLRPELANLLDDMKPAFMRFPGGCWVEGESMANAYRWKQTIGPLEERRTQYNLWGYYSNNGLGYHEYLQLCEDIGADPLFVVNCGMSHTDVIALENMGEYVQDALDAIEYANGATSTTWGALRAANGHPEPFGLKYLQIGNENGGTNYNTRYALFYDAVKAAYPEIKIISCVWGGTPTSRPLEIIDEHYYNNAPFFVANANKYDSYNRSGPQIYVGEFAVTSGTGKGNLMGALGEASFMTGMERNADIVEMSSYAPLFGNVNDMAWTPNLIYFDSSRVAPSPSYHVQQMFSRNRGDVVLPSTLTVSDTTTAPTPRGAVGLGSWSTAVEYSDVVVTKNSTTLYQSDFANQGATGWNAYNGTWSASEGNYKQTSATTTDCRTTTGDTSWESYTLSVRARKTSGSEGFLILFNWQNDDNWTWLNLGGWGNAQHGIEQNVNGAKTVLGSRVSGTIQTNRWYDISIVLTGTRIQCYLDGELIQDVTYPATTTSGLLASTSYDKSSGEIVVKAVNPYGVPMTTTLSLNGLDGVSPNATLIQLTSSNATATNTVDAPNNVEPVTSQITNADTNFDISFPANSLSILRLQAINPHFVTQIRLQASPTLDSGTTAAVTVWGQVEGQTEEVDLTGNAGYGITYSSANPDIASVDANGVITGVGAGTTTITATYGSLGLTSTITIQIKETPATLVHRYSFNETSGDTTADSVGGAAWDGTLPNGGVFDAGKLTLASGSQQYVNLPAGILSDYPAVTIDAWATFGTLPTNCFFYGFGNTSGNYGQDYIFCQPRSGRIAITASDWNGEQGTGGGGNWSGQTVHVTAVFNPPAGYVSLYVDGVLISKNSAVTVPFTSVNNVFSYIGRSLYSADDYMDVSLDEFRIYNGALTADQITNAQALGPNSAEIDPLLRLSISRNPDNGQFLLSWPDWATGYTLYSTTDLASPDSWTPVLQPPTINNESFNVVIDPVKVPSQFFRLSKP